MINTYAWIIDTANSSPIRMKIIRDIEIEIFMLMFFRKFLRREIRRCPAIMLADNRTARVKGRMIFLIISISTINIISM